MPRKHPRPQARKNRARLLASIQAAKAHQQDDKRRPLFGSAAMAALTLGILGARNDRR